ncbi:hypothetical protein V8E36_008727 [Tilletia maclaganii]
MSTQPCADNISFGPGSSCRRFDFVVLFENTMLVMLPELVFIALFLSIRLPRLVHKARLPSQSGLLGLARIGLAILSAILAVALLGLAQTEIAGLSSEARSAVGGWFIIAAQTLNLVTALMLGAAVWTERLHTQGGSFLLPLFFLASTLFDVARLPTFIMLSTPRPDGV